MLSIGTERLNRNIIESFVEYTVNCNFTSLRLDVIPNDILYGMCTISKENTFSIFVLEPFCVNSCNADPNSTAKSTEILEVVFLSYRQMNSGRTLSITKQCIVDTQNMKKGKGPVGNVKASTN